MRDQLRGLADVLIFGLSQQLGLTGDKHLFFLLVFNGLHGEFHDDGNQIGGGPRIALDLAHKLGGDLIVGQIGQRRVQHGHKTFQILGIRIDRQLNELIVDRLCAHQQHQNKGIGGGLDQLEPLDRNRAAFGGHCVGWQVCQLRNELPHLGNGFIKFLQLVGHDLTETLGLVPAEPVVLHELVDI